MDIFGGHILVVPEDVEEFDISPAYLFDSVRFMSPKPRNVSITERLFLIYSPLHWTLISTATILSAVFTKIFFNIRFQDKLLDYIAIFVGFPVKHFETNNLSLKVIFMVWFFSLMVLSKMFSNILFVLYATNLQTKVINSFDDVIQSNLPVYSSMDLKKHYVLAEEIEKLNSVDVRLCNNYVTCLYNVIENQNCITVGGAGIAKFYHLPKLYRQRGELMFHVSEEKILSFPLMFLYPKGHPLYKPASEIFLLSLSNGWLINKLNTIKSIEKRQKLNNLQHRFRISLKEFDILCLWIIGIALSLVVFVAEFLFNYCINRLVKKTKLFLSLTIKN